MRRPMDILLSKGCGNEEKMSVIEKIFGTHSSRELKRIEPLVDKIEALRPTMQALSDEELRGKTEEYKKRLTEGETLDDLLPEAYATVREAAKRVLNMEHYRVQLIGGIILHQGRIAEMRTGEGKTLVSTLPAYLNALEGKGVHVVTVNDYLAKRDAEWMGQVHEFLGLKVGVVLNSMTSEERQEAYKCDITYVTNNELGFDYLRDNMVIYKEQLVLRGLHYAIIDEVDSVLIDEARTPLIISGQSGKSTALYEMCDLLARQMKRGDDVQELTKMDAIMGVVQEETGDFVVNEKDKIINLTAAGMEKVERFFHIDNFADPENLEIQHNIILALRAHNLMFRDKDYVVKDDQVLIVDEFTGRIMPGRRYSDGLHQAIEAKEHVKVKRESKTLASITFQNFFNLFDKKCGMTGTALTEETEFREIYGMDVVVIPTNRPVIRKDLQDAVYKTKREKLNAIVNAVEEAHATGQPVLVGTITIEASEELSRMLTKRGIQHKVLNAKFHELEAEIVADAGVHGAVTIATNMAGRGTDIKLTPEVKAAGGLAIIGTERHESRRVDRQLRGRAGRQGDPGSSVFYVSLEDKLMRLFASERIAKVMDRLGFEDGERIESPMISKSIERAQRKVEENNFGIRKHLLEYDDVMNRQRTVIYEKRRHALMGERIGMDIANIIWDRVLNIVNNNDFTGAKEEFLKILAMEIPFTEDEYENGRRDELAERAFQEAMAVFKRKTERIQATAMPIIKQVYENQGTMYERIMVPITDGKRMYNIACNLKEAYESEAKSVVKEFEKNVVLQMIDDDWKENLRKLDELRHSVQNASYEQKDPLLIFKLESAKIWDGMINDMYDRISSILMRGQIPVMEQEQQVQEAAPEQHTQQNYVESKVDIDAERAAQEAAANQDTRENAEVNRTPYRAERMPRPNDPCPCGSGKKFKNCHGRNMQA